MDAHVPEDAARRPDIGLRRRCGVPADDGQLLQPADFTVGRTLADAGKSGVETAVEPHHHGRNGAGPLRQDVPAAAGGRQVQRDGLLTQDRQSVTRRCLDQPGMRVGGRADQHRVQRRVGKDIVRRSHGLRTVGPGQFLRTVQERVGHPGKLKTGMAADIRRMDPSDPARSQQGAAQPGGLLFVRAHATGPAVPVRFPSENRRRCWASRAAAKSSAAIPEARARQTSWAWVSGAMPPIGWSRSRLVGKL